MLRRLLNFLTAVDQLAFSIITFGHSSPDETISAAMYRMELQGKKVGVVLRPVIDILFFFDPKHCESSFDSEFRKLQLPEIYRVKDRNRKL